MAFNFSSGVRISFVALTAGALVSGCGGGSPDAEPASTSSPTSSSTTTTSIGNSSTSQTAAATQVDADADAAQAQQSSAPPSSGVITIASGDVAPVVTTPVTTTQSQGAPVTPPTSTAPTAPAPTGPIGSRSSVALNLGALSYYSPELPTIDVMKRAGAWLTQCAGSCTGLVAGGSSWDTKEEAALDLDANGWVKSLPASSDTTHKYRSVTTMLSANGSLPLGRYIVRYDGAGTISYSGFTKSSLSTAGRDVVDLTASGNAWMTISATNSSNYLRNIRVYLPGGACANDLSVYAASAASCNSTTGAYVAFESFPAGQIWNPQFVQDVRGFRALRFMDWNLTNTTKAVAWADRTPPDARIWTAATGAPIEAMMNLSSLVGADAWINVPPYANDDFAAHMGALAATHLTGVSKLDLEYANEPWNYAFPVAGWIFNQAKAKWPALVTQGVSPYTLADSWYGERAAQVCKAAKTGSNLVRCVVNSQAANSWITGQMLACPYAAAELGHACAKDIDVVAIAPYFGGYISTAKLRSVVATWYADPDHGLTKLFAEINGTDVNGVAIAPPLAVAGSGAPNGALTQAKNWMIANKAVVDAYGIPLWAYEGGQHLLVPNGDTDTGIQNLFVAANRDPRMGAAYDRMMSDWKSVSGQTFAYYSHVAPPSVYGMWGLKETLNDNTNAKWVSALKNRNDKTCNWSGC